MLAQSGFTRAVDVMSACAPAAASHASAGELGKMLEYFTRLWNERVNAPPKTDLVSMLAHGPSTRDMTPQEIAAEMARQMPPGAGA